MATSQHCGLSYGFGTFGDERLKKGGPCCIAHWSMNRVPAFADWVAASVHGKCASRGFCDILR